MSLQITFVTETWRPEVNGVAMTVGHLVDGLRSRGHQVSLVRPRQHRQEVADATEILLPGLPLPGYAGLRLGLPAGRALRRQWQEQPPDLVHVVTEGPLGWSAVNVARQLGIPVTSAFHTNFDHYSVHYGVGWLRPAVSAYLRSLHRRTRATMVPTEALAAMGLSVSDAVRILLKRVVNDQAFPLELKVPNAQTRAAMEEARAMTTARATRFDAADALIDDLEKARQQ